MNKKLFLYDGKLYWTRQDLEYAVSTQGKYKFDYPEFDGFGDTIRVYIGDEVIHRCYEIVELPPEPKPAAYTCESCYGFIPGESKMTSRCGVRRCYQLKDDHACKFYAPKGTKSLYGRGR